MNKVDAFGVVASCLLVWVFACFLLPFKVMMAVYVTIAAWAVGKFIGNLPRRLSKQTDKDFLEEMFEVSASQNATMREMFECIKLANAANQSLSAKIDELMLEYCPEDMTPQQIANYEAHQRAVNEPLH
jgi:hypothetical protein